MAPTVEELHSVEWKKLFVLFAFCIRILHQNVRQLINIFCSFTSRHSSFGAVVCIWMKSYWFFERHIHCLNMAI